MREASGTRTEQHSHLSVHNAAARRGGGADEQSSGGAADGATRGVSLDGSSSHLTAATSAGEPPAASAHQSVAQRQLERFFSPAAVQLQVHGGEEEEARMGESPASTGRLTSPSYVPF